jgi:hypothetical protein
VSGAKGSVDLIRQMQAIDSRIVDAARHVIPVLKDSGHANSARTLDELYFQRDAVFQQLTEMIAADPSILLSMLKNSGPMPGGAL